MTVSGNRQLGLMMGGQTQTPDDLLRVVKRIGQLQSEEGYPDMLLIMPGEIEAERLLADSRAEWVRMHVASNEDVLQSYHRRALWKSYGAYDETLLSVLRNGDDGGQVKLPVNYGNIDDAISKELLVRDVPSELLSSEHPQLLFPTHLLLATELSANARLLLRIIYEWPLIRMESIASLSGLSPNEADETLGMLEDKRLVEHAQIGGSEEPDRFSLSFAGLRRIGALDGVRNDSLLRKFRMSPGWQHEKPGDGAEGDASVGTEMRFALSHISRIDMTHDVLAKMRRDRWTVDGWRLVQAVPWHIWNRLIRGNKEVFSPYATVKLAHGDKSHYFFLDIADSRSITPSLQRRMEDYCRYLDSEVARIDFDGQGASMLVMLRDKSLLKSFSDAMLKLSKKPVPIFAAGWDLLEAGGMLTKAWHCPWEQHLGARSLREIASEGVPFATTLGGRG